MPGLAELAFYVLYTQSGNFKSVKRDKVHLSHFPHPSSGLTWMRDAYHQYLLLLLTNSIQNWKGERRQCHERGRGRSFPANLITIFQNVEDICDLKISRTDS